MEELLRTEHVSIDEIAAKTQQTALISAVENDHVDCALFLLRHGANAFAHNASHRHNILHLCAQKRSGTAAPPQLLIALVEELESTSEEMLATLLLDYNQDHKTPLGVAIDTNNTPVMNYLYPYYTPEGMPGPAPEAKADGGGGAPKKQNAYRMLMQAPPSGFTAGPQRGASSHSMPKPSSSIRQMPSWGEAPGNNDGLQEPSVISALTMRSED